MIADLTGAGYNQKTHYSEILRLVSNDGRIMKTYTFIISLLAATLAAGCVHSEKNLETGVQPSHTAFVPARIAVFPCSAWPSQLTFDNLPSANVDESQLQEICSRFDRFVIQGFDEQPYMRGLTPDAVKKLLSKQDQEDLLAQWPTLWEHKPTDCINCENVGSYYQASIANRPDWQNWLTQISRAVRNADALLMPKVLYVREEKDNQRGALVSTRRAQLALLLIDTNNGNLIWFGTRNAQASDHLLADAGNSAPPPPAWSVLYDRLFTNDLWRDFPGRQNY